MRLTLDRMALDDVGANPARLAQAIHDQLGSIPGAVPVQAIAHALDIVEIRVEPLFNLEGALVTTPERGQGQILVNASSSPRRRRFTISHELGHFLSPHHVMTADTGFLCDWQDLRARVQETAGRHRRQEAEANAFAIELLAPPQRLKRHLAGAPDLATVLAMSDEFEISREAAVRRYVELHRETLAVTFSQEGRFIYTHAREVFPRLCFQRDQRVPELPARSDRAGPSDIEEVDAADWLVRPEGTLLTAQTLHQQQGRAITLLHAVPVQDEDDDDAVEDAYQRFSKYSR